MYYYYFLLFKKKNFLWILSVMRDLLTLTSDHWQMQQCQGDSTHPTQVSGTASAYRPGCLLPPHWTVTTNKVTTEPTELANERKEKTSSMKEYLSVHHNCIWSTRRCFRLLIWKMKAFLLSNLLFIPPSMRRSWVWGRDWFHWCPLGVSLEQIWK